MVRRDEPLRDGEIAPIVARNTCYRGGTSTVGPNGFGPCGSGNLFMYGRFRYKLYTRTPHCSSLWWEWFHGYVPVVSPACCEVSPMTFDVQVSFCDVIIVDCPFCCDAPLLGKRTSWCFKPSIYTGISLGLNELTHWPWEIWMIFKIIKISS